MDLFGNEDEPPGKPRRLPRKPSYRLKPADVPAIKKRLLAGEFQNRIAADYDVNPGRIAEIATGEKFADIPPAP